MDHVLNMHSTKEVAYDVLLNSWHLAFSALSGFNLFELLNVFAALANWQCAGDVVESVDPILVIDAFYLFLDVLVLRVFKTYELESHLWSEL